MSVLYFTIFTGVESILPYTSDLGVMIQKGFRYTQHGGDGKFKEVFLPYVQESILHGDTVLKLTRSFSGMKSAGTGCFPHYFLCKGQPEPIALFLMVRACTIFRRVLAYVMEVRRGLNKGRIEAHCPSNNRRDKTTRNFNLSKSTVQLIPGDIYWMKVNPFQGERKIDSWWNEEDYEIACQVTNGSSSYDTKGSSGRVKVPHRNRFFQVATLRGVSMALCRNECANMDLTTHSALT